MGGSQDIYKVLPVNIFGAVETAIVTESAGRLENGESVDVVALDKVKAGCLRGETANDIPVNRITRVRSN